MADDNATPTPTQNPFTPAEFDQLKLVKTTAIWQLEKFTSNLNTSLHKAGYPGAPLRYPMFMAGGFFASLLLEEPVEDVDIFVLDGKKWSWQSMTFDIILGKYWEMLTDGKPLLPKPTHKYSKRNSHILSVYDLDPSVTKLPYKFQIMLTDYTTREECIERFDFNHCKISCDYEKLYVSPHNFHLILNKTLEPAHGYPEQYREDKFIGRDWSAPYKTKMDYDDDVDLGVSDSLITKSPITNAFPT